MFLSISTTYQPATDLGYLLHKHPDRCQSYELSFGRALVFYPEASEQRCEACLLLDVDPVHLVRGKSHSSSGGLLDQYVNDRPYVASSFMSVAIAQVYGSALGGRCRDRPDLVDRPLPLVARLEVLPVRGGPDWLTRIFEPLGYQVTYTRHPLDPPFADEMETESPADHDASTRTARLLPPPEERGEAGELRVTPALRESRPFRTGLESPYYSVQLTNTLPVATLLQHLYVLIPMFDERKHYYVGPDEVDKLLAKGEAWLAQHPERQVIASRYLIRKAGLARQALARLVADEPEAVDEGELVPEESGPIDASSGLESASRDADSVTHLVTETDSLAAGSPRVGNLHAQRLAAVLSALRASGAARVLDLGCGEGKLLRQLLADRQFTEIVGMDVSIRSLEIAQRKLKLERLSEAKRNRIQLLHGALTYRDARLAGYDAAALVEVIEHLDPARLESLERVVFEHARPATVIVTTPNREYNVVWDRLPADTMRHDDHRFEWTRLEFADWCESIVQRYGYTVHIQSVGDEHAEFGPPSQMAVFSST